jgi:hypothetical protein
VIRLKNAIVRGANSRVSVWLDSDDALLGEREDCRGLMRFPAAANPDTNWHLVAPRRADESRPSRLPIDDRYPLHGVVQAR